MAPGLLLVDLDRDGDGLPQRNMVGYGEYGGIWRGTGDMKLMANRSKRIKK